MQFLHYGGDVEAVDEEGRAARAVGMRQEVEQLEAAWIGLRASLSEGMVQQMK